MSQHTRKAQQAKRQQKTKTLEITGEKYLQSTYELSNHVSKVANEGCEKIWNKIKKDNLINLDLMGLRNGWVVLD